MIIFVTIVFIIIILLLKGELVKKIRKLEDDLTSSNDNIRILTKRISDLEYTIQFSNTVNLESSSKEKEFIVQPKDEDTPKEESDTSTITHLTQEKPETIVFSSKRESPVNPHDIVNPSISPFWQKMEKQFAENWTGIIGTIVLVLGIGFLGVYTALKMNEFSRFLMIVSSSAVMAALFFILKKKEKWLKLALWMRSASGAVFLFACLGAGGIPGLHWIHHPMWGLVVLLIGIALNLFLAMIGGKQIFASLHVLLVVIALTIAPQSETTIMIATVAAVFGIVLTFREKWDYHLLLSISSFFLYHVFWFFKMGGKDALTDAQNILGIIVVSVVCVLAACVHYRKLYGSKQFDRVPFIVHLVNWAYFGLGLLMHVSEIKWKTIPLFAGAAAAFILANYARTLKIRWLHCTDTFIAQIITILGVFSLKQWGVNYDIVMTILLIQILLFTRIVILVQEDVIYRVGIAASQISGIAVVITFAVTSNLGNSTLCIRQSALAAICAAGLLALHRYLALLKNKRFISFDTVLSIFTMDKIEFSITGVMTGLLFLCIAVFASYIQWLHYAFVGVALLMTVMRPKIATNGFTAGVVLLILGAHGTAWYILYDYTHPSNVAVFFRGIPLFLLSLAAARWDILPFKKIRVKWFGIYLFVLHYIILTHVLFRSVSPLIPGVLWLLASLIVLEIARFIARKYTNGTTAIGEPDRYLLHTGYALLAVFFFRHILVHLQSEEFIGFLKIRFAIEAMALVTMLYWTFSKLPGRVKKYKSWILLHPLFVEFSIIFAVLTISIEVEKYWHPLIWILSAFFALFIGKKSPALSRLKVYALLFYLASIFQVTFLLGIYDKLGTHWYEKDWFLGTVAIVFQFCFLVVFHRLSKFSELSFPKALSTFSDSIKSLQKHQNIFLIYPLLICVALFFYWTFTKSLLTLLLVLECFSVFVISIVLKEKHFRYTSFIGLGLCIIRLMFIDLALSTTLAKALVFLGVGIIMLGMHVLYSRFKTRFNREEPSESA